MRILAAHLENEGTARDKDRKGRFPMKWQPSMEAISDEALVNRN